MTFFIVFFFLLGLLYNFFVLRNTDIKRLDFLDGILIGQIYYVIIAMTVFFVIGSANTVDLDLTYSPLSDIETTSVILIGMLIIPTLRMMIPRVSNLSPDTSDPNVFRDTLIIFIILSILSFQMSGLSQGGHWQENVKDSLNGNPAFVYVKSASNIIRTAIFGALLYHFKSGRISAWKTTGIGLFITLFDLLMTFNRITAVYYLITLAFVIRGATARLAFAIGSLIVLPSLSLLWPMFRGLATSDGYNLSSFQAAASIAGSHGTSTSIDESLNSVLESSNILVLDWIVKNFDTPSLTPLHGDMFIRGLTVLIPRQLWPSRPSSFGVQMGDTIAHVPGLSLNSTLYGESFANFGWGWVAALPVFLVSLHYLFRLLAGNNRSIGAMSAFIGIAIWRFDSAFAIMSLIMLSIISLILWVKRDLWRAVASSSGRGRT